MNHVLALMTFIYFPLSSIVIDAWGKPGSGILTGNLAWLGDFDECQNIVSYYNSSYTSGSSFSLMPESFEGQYCSIQVKHLGQFNILKLVAVFNLLEICNVT